MATAREDGGDGQEEGGNGQEDGGDGEGDPRANGMPVEV